MKQNIQDWTYITIKYIIYKIKQNHTNIQPRIYTDKKWNQKNTKGYYKRNSHISTNLHMIYISSNNVRHPVTKPFATLHYTSLHFTQLRFTPIHYTCRHFTSSHLNFTQLHFTTLHPTTLHYNCRHFNSAHINFTQLHFTKLHFTSLHLSTLNFFPFKLHPTTLY
jgi:hypothetical protein